MQTGTIAITRPVGKGADTADLVRRYGWTPVIFHTVELRPLEERKVKDQLTSVLSEETIDWIVFMSSTGVRLFFDNLTLDERQFLSAPNRIHFLAVGPATRESLDHYGITDAPVPNAYSSAGVDEWFTGMTLKHLRIVLVRSYSADDSLARSLKSKGARVGTISLYESAMPEDVTSTFAFLSMLREHRIDTVLFTSAVSVSNFFKIAAMKVNECDVVNLLNRTVVGAIGPVTAGRLHDRGIEAIVPDHYLIGRAVEKLIEKRVQVQPA